jgi:glycosyltransferase involved in cell wall biosynthesis
MKIVYGLEIFLPHISGVTNIVADLAHYFSQNKNNKVFVITSSENNKYSQETKDKNYTILRLPSFKVPFKEDIRASYFSSIRAYDIIKHINPDIIHIHDGAFISFALAMYAKRHKIPVVFTQHANLSFPSYFVKFGKKTVEKLYGAYLISFLNNYCNLIIAPSISIKKELIENGCDKLVEVVSNGIDLNLYKPNVALRANNTIPKVLYVGRIDQDKNLSTFIKSIPAVLNKTKAQFVFVGAGDLRKEFIEYFNNTPYKNYVTFAEAVKPNSPELLSFYQSADVFVMPSCIETQSLATMEAMACGLPIVAANSGALPELVKNNKNGFLIPPYNISAFAHAIIKLTKNPQKRADFAKNSLQFIKKHNRSNTFQTLQNIYSHLIQNNTKLDIK